MVFKSHSVIELVKLKNKKLKQFSVQVNMKSTTVWGCMFFVSPS